MRTVDVRELPQQASDLVRHVADLWSDRPDPNRDGHDEPPSTTSCLIPALLKHDAVAQTLLRAMPDVFPWVRHLSETEAGEFAVELVEALSDAAELEADLAVREAVAGWRATARTKADPAAYRDAQEPTSGDYGPVDVWRPVV